MSGPTTDAPPLRTTPWCGPELPYDPRRPCPKCGNDMCSTEYRKAVSEYEFLNRPYPYPGSGEPRGDANTVLFAATTHRVCGRCTHTWDETPLDEVTEEAK